MPDSYSQQLQLYTVSSAHVECRLESMMIEEIVWGRQYVAEPSLLLLNAVTSLVVNYSH